MHTSNIDMLQHYHIICINVCGSIYITDLHTCITILLVYTYITILLVYMYVDPLDLYYLYTCMWIYIPILLVYMDVDPSKEKLWISELRPYGIQKWS